MCCAQRPAGTPRRHWPQDGAYRCDRVRNNRRRTHDSQLHARVRHYNHCRNGYCHYHSRRPHHCNYRENYNNHRQRRYTPPIPPPA